MKNHQPLQWISKTLVFGPESPLAGKKLGPYLLPFQKEIILSALNFKGDPNKNIFIGWSRKISKSAIYSWLLLYLFFEKEGVASGILASGSEQAGIIYSMIQRQIEINPNLPKENIKMTRDKLIHLKTYSSVERLYASPGGLLGRGLSVLVSDECGAQKDKACFSAAQSGMAFAKPKPLLLCASNPPESPTNWIIPFIKDKRKNRKWKCFEYAAKPTTPPFSEKALQESNPIFKCYVEAPKTFKHLKPVAEFLKNEAKEASQSPEGSLDFLRYQLGRRVSQKAQEWIDGSMIQVASLDDVLKLRARVVLGIDLALSWDIAACSVSFFTDDGYCFFYPIMHIPNISNRRAPQQKMFRDWHAQNFLTIQNEETLNKDYFLNEIKRFVDNNRISPRAVCWDRGLASAAWTEDLKYGETHLVAPRGGVQASPISEVQALAKNKRLYMIEENPAVRWCFSNAFVSEKSKGFKILNRESNRKSVDIGVAVCLSQWWIGQNPYKESVIMSI